MESVHSLQLGIINRMATIIGVRSITIRKLYHLVGVSIIMLLAACGPNDNGTTNHKNGNSKADSTDGESNSPICYPGGWCWVATLPLNGNNDNIWAASENDIWITTSMHGPALFHFNGNHWSRHTLYAETKIPLRRSLSGSSHSNVFTTYGKDLFRWDGKSWSLLRQAGYHIADLWVGAVDDVWTLEGEGLSRYNGEQWITYPLPPGATSRGYVFGDAHRLTGDHEGGVWIASASGVYHSDSMGKITPLEDKLWFQARFLFAPSAGELFVLGDYWYPGYPIQHTVGSRFSRDAEGSWHSTFSDIWRGPALAFGGRSASDIWGVIGVYQDLVHYDGTSWTKIKRSDFLDKRGEIHDIGVVGSELWFVGEHATILKYDGSSFSNFYPWSARFGKLFTSGESVIALDSWSSEVGFLNRNPIDLLALDKLPDEHSWLDIGGTSEANFWVVGGGGQIRHFDGVSFEAIDSGTDQTLIAIDVLDSEHGWIVGSNGTILELGPDGTWKPSASPNSNYLVSVVAIRPDLAYATGWLDFDTFIQWNGANWAPVKVTEKIRPQSVWGLSEEAVWVTFSFSDCADVQRWNGTAFVNGHYPPSMTSFIGVYGLSADNLWAFGNNGGLSHWDGTTWDDTATYRQHDSSWTDMAKTSSGELWLVGPLAGVMRHPAPDGSTSP